MKQIEATAQSYFILGIMSLAGGIIWELRYNGKQSLVSKKSGEIDMAPPLVALGLGILVLAWLTIKEASPTSNIPHNKNENDQNLGSSGPKGPGM